ncbi:MAG: alpha/beta hydrolase [Pirellulales bacterium]
MSLLRIGVTAARSFRNNLGPVAGLFLGTCLLCFGAMARGVAGQEAQEPPAKAPVAPAKNPAAPDAAPAGKSAEGEKIPPPEPVAWRTPDGVQLKATYYPGTKKKETVPVILLHVWKGSRQDYEPLALFLQQKGHAVLVPDLRGHGESVRVTGVSRPLDPETLQPTQYARMSTVDMEVVKRFLMEKNNAGELNIDKLCVVGAEMGALVALDWARIDWSWPPLATGKQGQDVKALVLISPEWSFKNLRANAPLAHPAVRSQISVLIAYGKDSPKSEKEAKRIYAVLERFHLKPGEDPREKLERQDLFLDGIGTSLQGTKILGERGLNLEQHIAKFIELRLVKKTYPWRDRTSPLAK